MRRRENELQTAGGSVHAPRPVATGILLGIQATCLRADETALFVVKQGGTAITSPLKVISHFGGYFCVRKRHSRLRTPLKQA